MAFGETDRLRRLAHEIVLLDEPPIGKVPPLRAVKHEIKTSPGGLSRFICRAAEGFGNKSRMGMVRLGFANEAPPKLLRHLVSRIAAEAFKAKSEQMLDDSEAVAIQPFGIARVPVIELGEITP